MVLQIPPHPPQHDLRLDAGGAKGFGIADAGQHQHLGRIDDAARQQHFAVGADRVRLAALAILHAGCAIVFQHDARNERVGLDGEVGPRHRRVEIGDGCAATPAVLDRVLVAADAFVVAAVEIAVPLQARGLARVGEGLRQRILEGRPAGAEWAVAAAVGVGAVLPGLLLFEIGQRVGVRPRRQAVGRPAVVVAAVAPRIGHGVDRGRAADHLAARALDPPPGQVRLGLGEVHPVVHAVGEDLAPGQGNVNPRIAVPAAGLEHQHIGVAVLGQPVRQHAAGRTRADDDVVVTLYRSHMLTEARTPDCPAQLGASGSGMLGQASAP